MNRRRFLTLFASGAVGFALDPERLLWVPGRRTYFEVPVYRHVLHSSAFTTKVATELLKDVYWPKLAILAQLDTPFLKIVERPRR